MTIGDRTRSSSGPFRIGTWRGDDRTAVVTPRPDHVGPAPATIRRCLDDLTARGYQHVVTSALAPPERDAFLDAGFAVRERLHLLVHDLDGWPAAATTVRVRRARNVDRDAVLALDRRAFDGFWGLDEAGLAEAIQATPISRFRVIAGDDGLRGYAVFGRAGDRGYVQRLAVDPLRQRQGIGTRLLSDGFGWMRRHRVRSAMVNTQEGNDAALSLYLNVGFRLQPVGLTVLTCPLNDPPSPSS